MDINSFDINSFIDETKKNIAECQKDKFCWDAYYSLPINITIAQIKEIVQKIEIDNIKCRLYSENNLQVFWCGSPVRTFQERFFGVPAMYGYDIEIQLKFFELAREEISKINFSN